MALGELRACALCRSPFLAVYLSFIDGYPSLARRVICSAMLSGLTVLQVVWTWNFCVPPEKQFPLP
jgi:hypothetical protein